MHSRSLMSWHFSHEDTRTLRILVLLSFRFTNSPQIQTSMMFHWLVPVNIFFNEKHFVLKGLKFIKVRILWFSFGKKVCMYELDVMSIIASVSWGWERVTGSWKSACSRLPLSATQTLDMSSPATSTPPQSPSLRSHPALVSCWEHELFVLHVYGTKPKGLRLKDCM